MIKIIFLLQEKIILQFLDVANFARCVCSAMMCRAVLMAVQYAHCRTGTELNDALAASHLRRGRGSTVATEKMRDERHAVNVGYKSQLTISNRVIVQLIVRGNRPFQCHRLSL
jgi:hypothetical protein